MIFDRALTDQLMVAMKAASERLSKREEIAALAMQGLLASGDRRGVATEAVLRADELLAALAKPT